MKETRRKFLASAATLSLGVIGLPGCVNPAKQTSRAAPKELPWYRRTLRWGQTNITETDPASYNIAWWRQYWKRTRVQGVIVNAGGIVAYYPSAYPLQYRAESLGARDLFGELARAAREDGLAVLARMDSSRAHENLYNAHPDWFALDSTGRPHKSGDLFLTCVNSPYYGDYLPGILREIAGRYKPEGFTDNSWSGLGREQICYCENCKRRFAERGGRVLPKRKNWDDPVYREWIQWNYARRLEIWDEFNRVTRESGGPDCLWSGMNSGSVLAQCQSFRDYKGIAGRAEIIFLDHQARAGNDTFAQNADAGQLIHSVLGWEKLVPESMAMYQAGRPIFRKTSKPEPEARLWMLEGLAGGLQPWWHHVGAAQEDRRQFLIAESIYRWHEANQEFLVNRQPVAAVGLFWSQRNTDFFGRDRAHELVELPWLGWTRALLRARIQYVPLHADDLDAQKTGMAVLVLPDIGALSDAEAASVRRFAQSGGAVIATGRTGLFDEWGSTRSDFVLADLFGCHYVALGREGERPREPAAESLHSYLRIERRSRSVGIQLWHPILEGFEDTDILPFGGWLGDVMAEDEYQVPLTFVPSFPVYPPETSWMRESRTKIPGLVLRVQPQSGKCAFLIADLDRRFATDNLPDHGRLLANLIRWAAEARLPAQIEGPGLIDCRIYRQSDRLILHLVNLTNTGAWRPPVDELIPVGPIRIRVQRIPGLRRQRVCLLVGDQKPSFGFDQGQVTITLPSLVDHQVVVIE
jgi:hypothetical protein